jgi:hypothetical protein
MYLKRMEKKEEGYFFHLIKPFNQMGPHFFGQFGWALVIDIEALKEPEVGCQGPATYEG